MYPPVWRSMTARVCAAPPSSRQEHGGQVAPLRALLGEEPRPRACSPRAAAGTCGASAGVFALLGADLCLTLERVLALLADLVFFCFL